MKKHFKTMMNVAAIILLGGLFLLTGCSGEDPAAPQAVAAEGESIDSVPTDLALWEAVKQMPDAWWGFDRSDENFAVTSLPFPDTPEQLMDNFRTIYERPDVVEYVNIMHLDFQTILQAETIQEFPDVGPTLDKFEEQNIHKRMFSGQALADPDGNLLPGISNIAFEVLNQSDVWQMTPNDDIIPDALSAPYEVQVLFDRGQSYSTLRVEGMIKFYVVSREFEYDGAVYEFFQMIGQVDLTGDSKATETLNWGSVKALFR